MKQFLKQNINYYIYPLIIILLLFLLSFMHLHGSSIGKYEQIISDYTYNSDILFRSPRDIRSDEILVNSPFLISQSINDNPTINTDIGIETNLITQYIMPTNNVFSIFKPYTWIFFLTENTEFSFSFFWWIRVALLLLSTYLLFILITNNIKLSIVGSLFFLLTPFLQWWQQFDTITMISIGLSAFILLIRSKSLWKKFLSTLLLSYAIISFGLILYPPFQIPIAWISIFLAIGFLLQEKYFKKNNKKRIRVDMLFLFLCISIVLFTLLMYIKGNKEVIEITKQTVYPGQRFISAGQGNFTNLLNGFYNILMQSDYNGAPYANQCEASNFLILSIFLLPWIIYKNIQMYKKEKKLDYLTLSICLGMMFLSIWYLFPLQDFISKYTGLYLVLPQRALIGIGFANIIIMILTFENSQYRIKNVKDIIFSLIIIAVTLCSYYLVGRHLYTISPNSFSNPTVIPDIIKIVGISMFTGFLIYLLLIKHKLFLFAFLAYAFLSTVFINPISKDLNIINSTNLAKNIQADNFNNSQWIAYGNHAIAQYALANGADVINGVHIYPQFTLWEIIDPEKKYINIYNRFAHISFSNYTKEDFIELNAMDSIIVSLDACDKKIQQLGIDFVISNNEMDNSCLQEISNDNGIRIYKYLNQ